MEDYGDTTPNNYTRPFTKRLVSRRWFMASKYDIAMRGFVVLTVRLSAHDVDELIDVLNRAYDLGYSRVMTGE